MHLLGLLLVAAISSTVTLAQSPSLRLRDHLLKEGTELDLRGTAVTDVELASLDPAEFGKVTAVLLSGTQITDQGLKAIARLSLRQLDLTRTHVTDAGLLTVAHGPLARLDLTGTQITDEGLKHLQGLPLRMLALRDTLIKGHGVAALGGMKLVLLDLSHTRVGDDVVPLLKAIGRINTLDLSDTAVTDHGAAALRGVRGVSLIDLSGTSVTPRAVADLQRALPAARVVHARRER